jgi:threonine dehydrogenase-like Zn-dependent dehydrogenase
MQALVYTVSPIGWATCKWLRYLWRGCLLSRLAGLALRDVDPPVLAGEKWVRVRTLLGGICGSDLGILAQKQRPDSILQAFTSSPMLLGHENVAVVEEVAAAVDPSWVGRRVCVEPTLCCSIRGIDPPCKPCRRGDYGACENFGAGGLGSAHLPPGTGIGYNRRTGGSFGERFVAHVDQLVPVPQEMSDEQAVLTDPLACSLHAVLRAGIDERVEQVLVYGAGVLGLGVIAALRATGFAGRIDALERAEYLKPLAEAMGADAFLQLPGGRRRYEAIAQRTGATIQRVRFGNYMLSGGYDVIFDCVGSAASINESLKWTAARGTVMCVGTGHGGHIDLTPVWFRELELKGTYGRQKERLGQRRADTYVLVHEMMRDGRLKTDGLLTHTFRLGEYRRAFTVAMNKGAHRAVKVAFDFRGNGKS